MKITLIDARNHKSRRLGKAHAAGIVVLNGKVPVNVAGNKAVAALEIADIDEAGIVSAITTLVGCEVVGMSGGYSPIIHLPSHRGIKPRWEASIHAFITGKTSENIAVIGAADGVFGQQACIDHARQLCHKLRGEKVGTSVRRGIPGGMRPVFEIQVEGRKLKAFIDPQHDVTSEDIRQAHREGFV